MRPLPHSTARLARAVGFLLAAHQAAHPSVAATVYDPGVAPSSASITLGTHLTSGPHTSVPGVGGSGINGPAGSLLDGNRTYIYDFGGLPSLGAGATARGDADFAMLIWDLGAPLNTMRLYTHQDHYSGGPITTDFVAQDVMEYSVWGSNDGDTFTLLSDVLGYTLGGGGPGLPSYTFAGTAPSVVYLGGSTELGIVNAYTRDYVFSTAYRYYGVRASTLTLTFPGGPDADPEIDAVGGYHTPNVPDGGSTLLLAALSLGALGRCRFGRAR